MAETWTPVGKVTPTPKGAWSSSVSYARLDIVSNNGASYIAIQGVPAGTAITNTSYWQKFADKGDTGATGATGNGVASIVVTETSSSGSAHNYRMAITMTNGDVTNVDYTVTDGAVTSVNGRTGAVTGLAEQDGYYDEMTVGGAEQLISSTYVEDSVPYVFRTSGGSADIGDREFDEIHGGTIAWNQLAPELSSSNYSAVTGSAVYSNGVGTLTPTYVSGGYSNIVLSAKAAPTTPSRKILYTAKIKSSAWASSGNAFIYTVAGIWAKALTASQLSTTDWNTVTGITVVPNNVTVLQLNLRKYYESSMATMDFKEVQVFDLTQMFGSTIADYIYSLEQANAGAGVAWFKSLFPKPYYAYNAGELISVSGLSAHKMTGFNALNTQNAINATNVVSANDNGTISIKDVSTALWSNSYLGYVDLVGGQTYAIEGVLEYGRLGLSTTAQYPQNNVNIPEGTVITEGTFSSLITRNRAYGKFVVNNSMRVYLWYCTDQDSSSHQTFTFSPCVHLVWDGERDGEYEPFESHEYALDSSLTLRGIPKLDADNKLYYDGDSYASDGSVERRYGIVDLGSLNWHRWDDGNGIIFNAPISDKKVGRADACCCPKYVYNSNVPSWSALLNGEMSGNVVNNNIYIRDNAYSTIADFKSAMSGVYLVYPLATPTTESAEPYISPQWVDDFGTEEYVIAEQSGVAIPVGHETKYTANLKAKLEMAPNSPSGDGDYIVRQTGGINTYVPLTERIPNAPSENGNYILKCTVSGSTVTYTWEAQS